MHPVTDPDMVRCVAVGVFGQIVNLGMVHALKDAQFKRHKRI